MPADDSEKAIHVEIRQLCQINHPCPVLGSTGDKSEGREVLRPHDARPVMVPFNDHRLLDRIGFKARRSRKKLDGQVMDQNAFFLEIGEAQLSKPTEDRLQTYEQSTRNRIKKNEDIDVPGGEWLTVKTGSGRTPDRVLPQRSVPDKPLEEITDFLHVRLMRSSSRVSRMNRPSNSIFCPTGRFRWLRRQRGMPLRGATPVFMTGT